MISRSVNGLPVSTLLLRFTEAGGDLGVFCYRMGVDIFSAGRVHFRVTAFTSAARRSQMTRTQVACSNLFSTFSVRFMTLKD